MTFSFIVQISGYLAFVCFRTLLKTNGEIIYGYFLIHKDFDNKTHFYWNFANMSITLLRKRSKNIVRKPKNVNLI